MNFTKFLLFSFPSEDCLINVKKKLKKTFFFKENPQTYRPNRVGLLYLKFSVLTGVTGILLAIYVITLVTGLIEYNSHYYSVAITGHAFVMVFFYTMPLLIGGFGNLYIPTMIKRKETSFPKISLFCFWLLVLSFFIFIAVLIMELTKFTEFGNVQNLLVLSMVFFFTSFFLVSINFLYTIFCMPFNRLPLFVVSMVITSLLLVLYLPLFLGVIIMFLPVFNYKIMLYGPLGEGDPLPWTHLFWFFAHPSIYVLLLPSVGIISHVIIHATKKHNSSYKTICFSMVLIGFLGSIIWILSLFSINSHFNIEAFLTLGRVICVIPLFIILTCWLHTLWDACINTNTPTLFAIGYVFTSIVGLLTGFVLALYDSNNMVHNMYYIIAHVHYMLGMVVFFAMFAGIYSSFNILTGVYYSEILSRIHFWLFFIGANLAFFPFFFLGLTNIKGMAAIFTQSSLLGLSLLIFSFLFFIYVIFESFCTKRKKKAFVVYNLNFFRKRESLKTLDFMIYLFYLFYGIIFFIISILYGHYMVQILYAIVFIILLLLIAFPGARYCFSPILTEAAKVQTEYKTNFNKLYYIIQFIKIGFLGNILCLLYLNQVSLNVLFKQTGNFESKILIFQKFGYTGEYYNVFSYIFFLSLCIEMVLKMYYLHKPITKKPSV